MAESATNQGAQPEGQLSWRFPPTFWFANGAELCERAAFYGMFITLMRYLNRDIGFTDVEAGILVAWFSSLIYFFPTFMGIMADKIGFKQALMIAFTLLTGGYFLLGALQLKLTAVIALALIMLGGAIIKPVISGTVAKTSDAVNRARAMSIFYMVVNIGSFSGKGLAGELNNWFGLQYINFYAAGMSFLALLLVAFFYKNPDIEGVGKTVGEALRGLGTVLLNFRFVMLIIIIGGFWAIQGQLYGSMPTYIERLLGPQYKPEWLANINPLVVVLLVVPITHLVRDFKPANAIGIGLLIIPFTALVVAMTPFLQAYTGDAIDFGLFSLHPMIVMFIIGIGLQGLAECFLSPKWLEFASKQAPKDEVGLYLGFSHLTTCVSWLFAFIMAGFLLEGFCPDPRTLPAETRAQWRQAINPHYLFTADADFDETLPEGGAVPADLRAAFAEAGVALPPGANIAVPGEGQFERDAARAVTSDDDVYLLVPEELENPETGETWTELLVESPEPHRLETPLPEVYAHANYIWYAFTGVGFAAFFGLLIFKFVTGAIDRRRGVADGGPPQA